MRFGNALDIHSIRTKTNLSLQKKNLNFKKVTIFSQCIEEVWSQPGTGYRDKIWRTKLEGKFAPLNSEENLHEEEKVPEKDLNNAGSPKHKIFMPRS